MAFRVGDSGESVRVIQRQLHELGFGHIVGDIDGKYGPNTKRAVEAFQRAAKGGGWGHLEVDGVWGQHTARAAEEHLYPKAPGGGGGGGGSGNVLDNLTGWDIYQFDAQQRQIEHEYDMLATDIRNRMGLTERQKADALQDLNDQRNNAISNLNARKDIYVRALKERYHDVLKKQPEQHAARGLLRSGVLLNRLQDIEQQRERQRRDYMANYGIAQEDIKRNYDLGFRNIHRGARDAGDLLGNKLLELEKRKKHGLNELEMARFTKAKALEASLRGTT